MQVVQSVGQRLGLSHSGLQPANLLAQLRMPGHRAIEHSLHPLQVEAGRIGPGRTC